MRKLLAVLMLAAVLALPWGATLAQTGPAPYAIYGYVYDEDGGKVAGARVVVTNERTGEWFVNVTDASGKFNEDANAFTQGWQYGDYVILKVEHDGKAAEARTKISDTKPGSEVLLTLAPVSSGTSEEQDGGLLSYVWLMVLVVVIVIMVGTIFLMKSAKARTAQGPAGPIEERNIQRKRSRKK